MNTSLGLESELAREIRTIEKQNSELWINARAMGWNIFSPDWEVIGDVQAYQLRVLCGLSVGLNPCFCDESWLSLEAKFHLNGEEPDLMFDSGLDKAHVGAYQASKIDEFKRRLRAACGSLEPEGVLPIASGEANSQFTRVKATKFISWAQSKGWEMPVEFVDCFDSIPPKQNIYDRRKDDCDIWISSGINASALKDTDILKQLKSRSSELWGTLADSSFRKEFWTKYSNERVIRKKPGPKSKKS